MKALIERIIQLREEKDLSQKDVASSIGYSPQVYNRWEKGKTEPDYNAVISLAKFYNVSTDYLFGITNVKNPNEIIKKFEKLDNDTQEHLSKLMDRLK